MWNCPKKVVKIFKEDLMEVIALRAVQRLHSARPTCESTDLIDHGILLQPLKELYNKYDARRKQTLLAVLTDGIFTDFDLFVMGYSVDPSCKPCGNSYDTIFHRCCSCPSIEGGARHALGDALFDRLIAGGERGLLANRLLMRFPDIAEEPVAVSSFQYVNTFPGDTFLKQDGAIFGDGSLLFPSVKELSRGGYAVVQIRNDGEVHKAIYAPLQAGLDQTSLNTEFLALSLAAAVAEEGAVYAGDCQAILDVHHGEPSEAVGSDNVLACGWKALDQKVDIRNVIQHAIKTKAHRNESQITDDDDWFMFKGNQHADHFAKLGAGLHPPNSDDVRGYKRASADLKKIAEHLVDVLGVLRMSRLEQFGRTPKLPKGLRWKNPYSSHNDHQFMWINNTRKPNDLRPSRRQCTGPPQVCSLFDNAMNHKINVSALKNGEVFVFCSRCFCYAAPHPRRLVHLCDGDARNNPASRYYISRGFHPVTRERLQRPLKVSQVRKFCLWTKGMEQMAVSSGG